MGKQFILIKTILMTQLLLSCNPTPQRLQNQYFTQNNQVECEENQILNQESNTCEAKATDTKSLRPDKAIDVVLACACKEQKSITYGQDCESFCSSKTTQEGLLYIELNPKAEIALNSSIKTVRNWCNIDIDDSGTVPVCRLDVVDINNNLVGTIKQTSDNLQTEVTGLNIFNDSLTVNLSSVNMQLDNTYYIKFQEETSGATWSSNIQVALGESTGSGFQYGLSPLLSLPVNQYSCLLRRGETNDQKDTNYLIHDPFFYYFTYQQMPQAIPAGLKDVVCHDYQTNSIDRADLPRLALKSSIYSVWNSKDPRFADEKDSNGETGANSILDIEDLIRYKLKKRGVITNKTYFKKHEARHMPNQLIAQKTGIDSDEKDELHMGYILSPFIDRSKVVKNTYLSYCPTGMQYNSNNPEQQVLGDIIGNDTEGLYYARSEITSHTLDDGDIVYTPANVMLIKQGLLEKIWFFINSEERREQPTNENAMNKTLHFYWPVKTGPSPDHTIRAQGQKLYTILVPTSEGNGIIPHDNKVGCVPKTKAQ